MVVRWGMAMLSSGTIISSAPVRGEKISKHGYAGHQAPDRQSDQCLSHPPASHSLPLNVVAACQIV
jgi:hypothetical protein